MKEQKSLSERLRRLERSNSIVKTLAVAAFAALLGFGQLPSPLALSSAPKTFSAQQFVLVNSTGSVLATLGAGKNGGAVLTFLDPHGNRVMSAGAFDDNSGDGLGLYDGNTIVPGNGIVREGIGMAVAPNPFPGIGASVFGPDGHLRVSWGAFPDGTLPGFASYDSAGTVRTFSGIQGDPRFIGHYVFDSSGLVRNGIQTDERDNFNGLFANDADGTNRVTSFEALDGSFSYSEINSSAGSIGAHISNLVTGDGSFSQSALADGNGVSRVESFQAGGAQGVNTFDSSGNPAGNLP